MCVCVCVCVYLSLCVCVCSSTIYIHTFLCFIYRLRDETDSVQVRNNCERRLEELRVRSEEVQSLLIRSREEKKETENANDVTTKELREVRYVRMCILDTYITFTYIDVCVCLYKIYMFPDHPQSILSICTYVRTYTCFRRSKFLNYYCVRTYVHMFVQNT